MTPNDADEFYVNAVANIRIAARDTDSGDNTVEDAMCELAQIRNKIAYLDKFIASKETLPSSAIREARNKRTVAIHEQRRILMRLDDMELSPRMDSIREQLIANVDSSEL